MALEIWLLMMLLAGTHNHAVASSSSSSSREEVLCTNSEGMVGRVRVGSSTTLAFHEQPIVWVELETSATSVPNDDATLLHWKPLSTTTRYQFQLQGNNTIEEDVVCLYTEEEVDSTKPTEVVWIAGTVWQESNTANAQQRLVWIGAIHVATNRMLHYHEEPVVNPQASLQALERDHTQHHTVLLLRWMESSNTTTVATTQLDTANWTGFAAATASNNVHSPRRLVGIVTLGLLCGGMLWAFTSSGTDGSGVGEEESTQKDASTTGNTSCDDSVGQTISNAASMMDTSMSFQFLQHPYSRSSSHPSADHVVL